VVVAVLTNGILVATSVTAPDTWPVTAQKIQKVVVVVAASATTAIRLVIFPVTALTTVEGEVETVVVAMVTEGAMDHQIGVVQANVSIATDPVTCLGIAQTVEIAVGGPVVVVVAAVESATNVTNPVILAVIVIIRMCISLVHTFLLFLQLTFAKLFYADVFFICESIKMFL